MSSRYNEVCIGEEVDGGCFGLLQERGVLLWFVHSSKFEGPVIVSLEPWVWLKAL